MSHKLKNQAKNLCISLACLLMMGSKANAESVYFSQYNEASHIVFPFQAVFTSAFLLKELDVNPVTAVVLPSAFFLTFQFIREEFMDSSFSTSDFLFSSVGTLGGALLFWFWPGRSDSYSSSGLSFEPDFGILDLNAPFSASTSPKGPPNTIMGNIQSTFWYHRQVGLHLFSGGSPYQDIARGTKNLIMGGGLRVSLYPVPWASRLGREKLSVWGGIDYGVIVYSFDSSLNLGYPAAASVFFPTVGLRLSPFKKTSLHLGSQVSLIPYGSQVLLGLGLQAGFLF